MKTPEQWIEELRADPEAYHAITCECNRCNNGYETFLLPEDVASIQADARADMEDATLKSAYAQQSLMHEVDALKEQNAKMREILESLEHVRDSLGHCRMSCPRCRWEALRKEIKL